MSASRQRISARDYKHGGGRRGSFGVRNFQQFLIGLAAGLAVALAVFVMDHRGGHGEPAVAQPLPAKHKTAAASDEPEEPVEQYEYYDRLSKFEAVLPEERMRRDQPLVPITKPGAYMIQAGSFVNENEAQRRQQQLAKLGIDAVVQRVAIDADVKHRVRIGPVSDLKRLNEMRNQLRTADIDMLISGLPD